MVGRLFAIKLIHKKQYIIIKILFKNPIARIIEYKLISADKNF